MPQRDADIRFLNEQGLHGEIYKVWVDAERIHDPETDTYDYTGVDDYLADASLMSDELLMVMDTRVSVRDMGRSPEDIRPIIRRIMTDLKKRLPADPLCRGVQRTRSQSGAQPDAGGALRLLQGLL